MSESDIYVEALRQLCAAHGGPEVVAERAGLSSENLKQILKGVLLPSGNPRGVGPGVRKALNESYPGWASGEQHNHTQSNPPKRPSFPSNENAGLSPAFVPTARNTSIIPANPQPTVVVALNWEQLMEMILKEGLRALEAGLWVEVQDDSMVPEFNPGDLVMLERIENYTFKAGDRVLVREQGGDVLLREYRAITSKTFDAVPLNRSYGTLHSATHGLEPLAKVTRLTKMYG